MYVLGILVFALVLTGILRSNAPIMAFAFLLIALVLDRLVIGIFNQSYDPSLTPEILLVLFTVSMIFSFFSKKKRKISKKIAVACIILSILPASIIGLMYFHESAINPLSKFAARCDSPLMYKAMTAILEDDPKWETIVEIGKMPYSSGRESIIRTFLYDTYHLYYSFYNDDAVFTFTPSEVKTEMIKQYFKNSYNLFSDTQKRKEENLYKNYLVCKKQNDIECIKIVKPMLGGKHMPDALRGDDYEVITYLLEHDKISIVSVETVFEICAKGDYELAKRFLDLGTYYFYQPRLSAGQADCLKKIGADPSKFAAEW